MKHLAIILAVAACGNPTVKDAKTAAINCAKHEAPGLIAALQPSVAVLLEGNQPDWKSNLDAILDALGSAAACSLKEAVAAVESKITNVDIAKATPPATALKNGRAIIAERKYRFVEVDDETPPGI